MKTLYFLLSLLSVQVIAAPLSNDDRALLSDRAKAIYVKKTYLKNADKKIQILKRKIELLKAKDKQSKKVKEKIQLVKNQLNKIFLWKQYHKLTVEVISVMKKNTPGATGSMNIIYQKRGELESNYQTLINEKFQKIFIKKHGLL